MVEGFHRPRIAAAVAALALGVGVAAAAAGTRFPDPLDDVRGGAGPDIVSVSVSHSASRVTFRLRFAEAPPLGVGVRGRWVDMLLIGLDVPPRGLVRSQTGWLGTDYVVGLHGTDRTATLVRTPKLTPWRGTVVARPAVAVTGRTLSFSISRSALGDPAWLELVVAAGRETSDPAAGGTDEAPARGAFHYTLADRA